MPWDSLLAADGSNTATTSGLATPTTWPAGRKVSRVPCRARGVGLGPALYVKSHEPTMQLRARPVTSFGPGLPDYDSTWSWPKRERARNPVETPAPGRRVLCFAGEELSAMAAAQEEAAAAPPGGAESDATETEEAPQGVSESDATAMEAAAEYSWPQLHFDRPPRRLYHFAHQFRSATSSGSNSGGENFLKGVKWSPDGSSFLTSSDDNSLRLFYL